MTPEPVNRRSNPYCEAHGEYIKATSDLSEAVVKLTTVVDVIVGVGKAVFALALALIVVVLLGIFEAGQLYNNIKSNTEQIAKLSTTVSDHLEKDHGVAKKHP